MPITKIIRYFRVNPKNLWRRYVAALSIIVGLFVGGHVVGMSASQYAGADAGLISMSARQEMLSYRILDRSLLVVADPKNTERRKMFADLINEFEHGHKHLLSGGGDERLIPSTCPFLKVTFFEGRGSVAPLESQISAFIASARKFNALSPHDMATQGGDLYNSSAARTLIETLHRATGEYENVAHDRGRFLYMVQMALLGIGILVVMLEALLIFWPAHWIAREAMTNLEEKSKHLETANRRLGKALTDAHKARTEADRSNKAKSMFLANMSHELRTPLNAIIGFSSMIRSEIFGKNGHPNYTEYANDIENSGAHLLELIGDLMDISQVEVGATQLDLEQVDVTQLVDDVVKITRGWPQATRRVITTQTADAPAYYLGDARRLRQIALNLLSNAIKFTSEGDSILVKAHVCGGDGLQLMVQDSGPGFDPDEIEQLTQPFQRGDNAFTRNAQGTGLGLSLVSAFVQMHGGNLYFENVEGGGGRVTALLPGPEQNEISLAA